MELADFEAITAKFIEVLKGHVVSVAPKKSRKKADKGKLVINLSTGLSLECTKITGATLNNCLKVHARPEHVEEYERIGREAEAIYREPTP